MGLTPDDLHGSCPDESSVALVLIDVINDLEFADGEDLLASALPAARAIARLRERAKAAGVPVIYANDNFGRWRSDFTQTVRHCLEDGVRGEPIARLLRPGSEDYFILKPKHSAFFETSLRLLLEHLGCRTLILTGFNGDICVLFTAKDAYMSGYRLVVPPDCVASVCEAENDYALRYLERVLKGELTPSDAVDFAALAAR